MDTGKENAVAMVNGEDIKFNYDLLIILKDI